jgi:hypothetical protein
MEGDQPRLATASIPTRMFALKGNFFLSSGFGSECIDAPGPTTRKGKVQKNKTIQNSCITAIQDWEKISRRVSNEIGKCHNPGQQNSYWTCEKPENKECTTEELKNSSDTA